MTSVVGRGRLYFFPGAAQRTTRVRQIDETRRKQAVSTSDARAAGLTLLPILHILVTGSHYRSASSVESRERSLSQ
jgi:hypothetical protein